MSEQSPRPAGLRGSGSLTIGEGVSAVDRFDFDKLLEDLSQVAACRRDKVIEVKRLVQANRYETRVKLRVALERLIGDIDP